jgi:hypothetical protein
MARLDPVDQDDPQARDSGDGSTSFEDSDEATSRDDETSSSGSSSDETESDEIDSDEDEEGTDLNQPSIATPPSCLPVTTTSSTDLKSRLTSFIPQLQQANAELATDPNVATKRVDAVDDEEEQYIEMNLGLGVLKAKPMTEEAATLKTTVSEDSESSDDSASVSEDEVRTENTPTGIVDKLKGVKPVKRKIEEVG